MTVAGFERPVCFREGNIIQILPLNIINGDDEGVFSFACRKP
jgi:hypothetical protein